MGLFDLKSGNENPSIDLTDFKFLSDDHTRFENGRSTQANNKGAWRGIRVKTSDNKTFHVTIYNMNENHPIWGDNIQMSSKQMNFLVETNDKIVFRGFGSDVTGGSFADYGLTIHKSDSAINKMTLHMYDRNIDILYEKAEDKKQSETLDRYSDFDNFKSFIHKWNSSMTMDEKIVIAFQSDSLNNKGVNAYNMGNIHGAINFYEQAIFLMPNNDDSLKNLRICYSQVSNYDKVAEVIKKLEYLSKN